MNNQQSGKRLAAILAFVAAALGFAAAGVRFFADREVDWGTAALAVLLLAMGFSMLRQSRSATPPS